MLKINSGHDNAILRLDGREKTHWSHYLLLSRTVLSG